MFARQALIGLTLISSIFALQDCCYLEPDQMQYQGGLVSLQTALENSVALGIDPGCCANVLKFIQTE